MRIEIKGYGDAVTALETRELPTEFSIEVTHSMPDEKDRPRVVERAAVLLHEAQKADAVKLGRKLIAWGES